MSILGSLIRFESSGKNVTNVDQSTSSGRARGFFQITDGTWQEHAGKAGVDLSRYPTALSAPYAVQLAVAKTIQLKRWDPITLRRMSAAGETFDINKTLGENMAAKGETGAAGSPGTPTPAAAAAVTGAGQSTGNYASPETPVPGATQPNYTPSAIDPPDTSALDKPDLASAFGDALGKMSTGGGGASGGTSGDASLGNMSLTTNPVSDSPASDSAAPMLSQLANLFTLPTIGQGGKKAPINIASKSWI